MKLKVLASGSSGNCYLLQSENETLILECGINYKNILHGLNFNLKGIVGCLITHEHKDHSKAITDIFKAGIDVYLSEGTAREILKENVYNHRLHFIKSEEQLKVSNFIVLPFATEHDATEPLGFLIQHPEMGKMLFATDTYYIQYKFTGLNHILIECNYDKNILNENINNGLVPNSLKNRLIQSHFSLDNVKEFLRASENDFIENIVLLHISNGNGDTECFKSEIERLTGKPVYIAEKGLEIELGR